MGVLSFILGLIAVLLSFIAIGAPAWGLWTLIIGILGLLVAFADITRKIPKKVDFGAASGGVILNSCALCIWLLWGVIFVAAETPAEPQTVEVITVTVDTPALRQN